MQPKYYEIQPGSGSHYLLENGEPIARFNELEKTEAARAMYVAELAAMYERNAERFASTASEKEAVIKAYDSMVKSLEDRKKLEIAAPLLVAARDSAVVEQKRNRIQQELAARSARQSNSLHRWRYHRCGLPCTRASSVNL
jgi:uncharacterized membrane protein YccC